MPNTKGTQNLPIRFTDEERAKIEAIKKREGLPSLAAAVRHAIDRYTAYREEMDRIFEKKFGKRS